MSNLLFYNIETIKFYKNISLNCLFSTPLLILLIFFSKALNSVSALFLIFAAFHNDSIAYLKGSLYFLKTVFQFVSWFYKVMKQSLL